MELFLTRDVSPPYRRLQPNNTGLKKCCTPEVSKVMARVPREGRRHGLSLSMAGNTSDFAGVCRLRQPLSIRWDLCLFATLVVQMYKKTCMIHNMYSLVRAVKKMIWPLWFGGPSRAAGCSVRGAPAAAPGGRWPAQRAASRPLARRVSSVISVALTSPPMPPRTTAPPPWQPRTAHGTSLLWHVKIRLQKIKFYINKQTPVFFEKHILGFKLWS